MLHEISKGKRVRVVYIRVAKGLPPETEQRAEMIAKGAEPGEMADAWVDKGKPKPGEQRQRDYMLGAIRPGDEVWISRPAIIGASEPDILDFLARMTEQGGVLYVASSGRRYRWHQDAADALRLAQDIKADERDAVMAKARGGIRKRRETLFSPEQWALAERLWHDHTVTAKGVQAATGINWSTLYHKYGPRGTPAFGRPFKAKKGKGKR